MIKSPLLTSEKSSIPNIDYLQIFNALTSTIVVLGPKNEILLVNAAGEHFFGGSADYLQNQNLTAFVPSDSPLFNLIERVRKSSTQISEYDVTLESPRINRHKVNIHAAPIHEYPGRVVLTFHQHTITDQLNRGLSHQSAARTMTSIAAMMAHEVKNPLSGIRGAAQLLESEIGENNRKLTRLICNETDRIVSIIERMEGLSECPMLKSEAINIHRVLEQVYQLAKAGFTQHIDIIEEYDPSLPSASGHYDSLVQVFLNLLKNAAEAVPKKDGKITLRTAFRHGVHFTLPGSSSNVHLPLVVEVQDNGPGVPQEIRQHLFDAFVTTKPKGRGLGLAIVAKIIDNLGGLVEFDSEPRKTVFRVRLPIIKNAAPASYLRKETIP